MSKPVENMIAAFREQDAAGAEAPRFEQGKHYAHKASCGHLLDVEHTHWEKQEGGLVSLFSAVLHATGEDRSSSITVHAWEITPAELRNIAAQMSAAADDLEAHIAEVAGQKGGA